MERLTNFWGNLKKCVECSENSNYYSDHSCHHIADSLAKLRDYEDLEEQGKLLKLPCAVGDTYYRIENDGANPPYISEWEVHTIEFCVNVRDNIGKTVFLAREEAEAALKELERGKGE